MPIMATQPLLVAEVRMALLNETGDSFLGVGQLQIPNHYLLAFPAQTHALN